MMDPAIKTIKPEKALSKSETISTNAGLTATRIFCAPWQPIPTHAHEESGIFVTLGGQIIAETKSDLYDGKMMFPQFCKPGEKTEVRIGAKGLLALHFEFDKAWLADSSFSSIDFANLRRGSIDTQLELIRLNIDILSGRVSSGELDSRTIELMVGWSGDFSDDKESQTWLRKSLEEIHSNFRQGICLRSLANRVGIHPVHLARVFRSTKRQTLSSYVRSLRLIEANRLILEGMSIGDAAMEVGFDDQSVLSRAFRQEFGIAPSKVKRKRG